MLRKFACLSAAAAAATVLSVSAFAANGGIVGDVVGAGENIVNDVVGAGEDVVDDVADAVTGDNNGTNGGTANGATNGGTANSNTNGATNSNTSGTANGTTNGTTSGNANGTTTPQNPVTADPFSFAAVAAMALAGAGLAVSARRDD